MSQSYIMIIDPHESQGKQLAELLGGKFDISAEWAVGRDHAVIRAEEINRAFGRLELIVVVLTGDRIALGHPSDAVTFIRDRCYPKKLLVLTAQNRSNLSDADVTYVRVRSSEDLLAQICEFIAKILPEERLPCTIALKEEADLVLQHQLLTFQSQQDPTYAWLGRIIRKFFHDCESAEVWRLTQGFSGSLVVAVSVKFSSAVARCIVLKLAPSRDRIKLQNGVENWDEIKDSLNFAGLRSHTPEPIVPETKHDRDGLDERIVEHAGILAIAYTLLGQQLGDFCDLESAYCDQKFANTKTHEIVLRKTLNVLNQLWYSKPLPENEVNCESSLWTMTDHPDRELRNFPPYALSRGGKVQILASIEQLDVLGKRLARDWYSDSKVQIEEFLKANSMLPERLTRNSRTICSRIHGDLNRNNIFYWLEFEHVFLLDFSTYQRNGHMLQDFAQLETQIIFGLMDREAESRIEALDYCPNQLASWIKLQDTLYGGNMFDSSIDLSSLMNDQRKGLERAYELVQLVRSTASAICKSRDHPLQDIEYRSALLYHTLKCIGFSNLSPFKRMLAVYNSTLHLREIARTN
jgi:hypothetical protein